MPAITKKRIVDDILNIVEKFSRSDDSRKDETWLSNKIDQVGAQLKVAQYLETGQMDPAWFTDVSLKTLTTVNFSDDPNVGYCCSDMSKCTIPNIVSFPSKNEPNGDLGLTVLSACGSWEYFYMPLSLMKQIPKDHVRSKFNYYARINLALYVNKLVSKLRIVGVLAHPEDGYILSTDPVTTIASGTAYVVRGGPVVYNHLPYQAGDTFSGVGGQTTYTGTGLVYPVSILTAISETMAYPVTAEMARNIVLEICTKEFKIESVQIPDKINDSRDDNG